MKLLRVLAAVPVLTICGIASSASAANNLTLSAPAYDTSAQKFGSAALSSGYGVTASPGPLAAAPWTMEAWAKGGANTAFGRSLPAPTRD